MELEGEWPMLSCIRDGEVLPPDWIGCGRRVFAGDRSRLFFGKQVFSQSQFSLDSVATPTTLDHEQQFGIYELGGDRLRTSLGVERAVDYAPGRGRTVSAWRRI